MDTKTTHQDFRISMTGGGCSTNLVALQPNNSHQAGLTLVGRADRSNRLADAVGVGQGWAGPGQAAAGPGGEERLQLQLATELLPPPATPSRTQAWVSVA